MPTLTPSDRFVYAARLKAFLGHIDQAEALLTEGLEQDPDNAVMLRQRGHRRLTLRDYQGALQDFAKAIELIDGQPDEHEFYQRDVEPDLVNIVLGREDRLREQHLPVNEETNAATAGMYKSTLHGSIWYHSGVAKYLTRDFEGAFHDFGKSAELAIDDDAVTATFDWRYMALRRLGRDAEAQAMLDDLDTSELTVTAGEDFYFRRLRLYKGEVTADEVIEQLADSSLALATQGYGVGNWYLYNGDSEAAVRVFESVIENGAPHSFAYMAAEAELARMRA
jgi:tetratricopeptide (TPR) repeat protein